MSRVRRNADHANARSLEPLLTFMTEETDAAVETVIVATEKPPKRDSWHRSVACGFRQQ